MGNKKLKIKNRIKGTSIGVLLRNAWQRRYISIKNAYAAIEKYYSGNLSAEKKRLLVEDMLNEAKKFNFDFNEYFMYGFDNMPYDERRTYISKRERLKYVEKMNNPSNMIFFDDKGLTYKKFADYYGVCCKIKMEKVAEQKWRKLHLQNGEKCRAPDYAL